MREDNWGWRARIGMFIVGNEAVPEAEWWAMAPPGVSVHAARVSAPTPWATWNHDRSAVALADDMVRGARQFAAMRLQAVVVGHSSSSILGGEGWDEAVVAALSSLLPGVAVSTNGIDCIAALRMLGVVRPLLVLPPWFGLPFLDQAAAYCAARGAAPVRTIRYDPGPGWRDLPPGELYAHGMGFAQQIAPLYEQVRAACPDDADGVLLAGTGFRCVGVIEALERDLGRPVVTANQASLWHGLRQAGVRPAVEGYGALLRGAR